VRKAKWVALLVAMALVVPCKAQTATTTNTRPRTLSYKKVAVPQQSSGIARFIPKLSLPSFSRSPKIGPAPMPIPGPVPSTKNKGPYQPVAPFTPKN
jgi:hypothetical protein